MLIIETRKQLLFRETCIFCQSLRFIARTSPGKLTLSFINSTIESQIKIKSKSHQKVKIRESTIVKNEFMTIMR